MKKIISVLISVFMLLGIAFYAEAAVIPEDTVMPLWDNIFNMSNEIVFNGITGKATAGVTGKSGTTLISGVLTVYKQDSNGGWSSVNSNSRSSASNSLSLSVNFTGVKGGYYKSVLTTTVYVNGVGETETATTYKTCP